MTRVSKVAVKKDVIEDILDSFVSLISDFKDKAEIKAFINDFLTPEERFMLSKRLELAFMVRQGFSWDEIASILKVSKTSINQMKHWISYKKGIEIGVGKLIDKQNKEESVSKVEGILKHIPPLTRSKKDMAKWLSR